MKKLLPLLVFTLFFTTIFNTNAQNNALHFDGTDDYVITSQFINLSFQSYAIEGWFKADIIPSTGEYPHVFGIIDGPADAGFVRINGDSQQLEFVMKSADGYKVATSPEVIQPGIWYHAAILLHHYPGFTDTQYLLINGEVVAYNQFPSIGTYSNYLFGIGGDGTRYFDGQVDDVKVWANWNRSSQDVRASMYKEVVGNESNLVAYYNLNETSGTSANDSQSSSTYDGTLTNMSGNEWSTSPAFFGPKNCLDFDGLDANVWCPSITPTVTSGTIEFWVNLDVIPTDNARLISRGANYSAGDEIYIINNNGRIATTGSLVVGDDLISTNPLPTDVWTHVAVTADGSGSKLYINGVLDDTGGAAAFGFDSFRFGGQFTDGYYEGIDGMMDEVRLWSDVRTESEIRENMFKNLVGDEANLVAYYNLDNAAGAVTQSYPAEANDGGIGGGATWVASSAFNTWLNTNSSDLATPSNWSNGIPAPNDNVGINDYSGVSPVLIGNPTVNNLFIGSTSGIILNSGFTVNGNLFLNDNLDLNGQTITLGSTTTLYEDNGIISGNTGSITTTRNLNNINENIAGLGATITTIADMGSTTISRSSATQTITGNNSINRFFDITPTNNTGLNVTLSFNYLDAELNGLNESDLELFKSTDEGSSWAKEGGIINTVDNTITLNGIDGFSRWTAAEATALCLNPTNGGTIASAQSNTGSFDPAQLTSTLDASGESGTLEYKWQKSTISNSVGFSDITSSNAAIYDPTTITETTWYKRLARVDCETDWSGALESNVLEITILVPMSLVYNTNLSAGTTITLPLYGTVNVTVDWGDSGPTNNYTTPGDVSHTYASEGTYTVSISGTLTVFGKGYEAYDNVDKLISVSSFGNVGLIGIEGAFHSATNLTTVPSTLPSTVNYLSYCFSHTTSASFTGLDSWDVTNVTWMPYMFEENSSYNQDISAWNVSNITNFGGMFRRASSFNQPIGSWTVGSATDVSGMFFEATAFDQDISSWDVSNVTNMDMMFYMAESFNQNVGGWNVGNVTNMSHMFDRATVFNQDLGNWDVSKVTDMNAMFIFCWDFDQDLSSWEVGNVTNMSGMFSYTSLSSHDLSGWDVSKVTDMSTMFWICEQFNGDVSTWDVGNVTSMSHMFGKTPINQDLSSWDVSKVTDMNQMFRLAGSFNQDISGWNVSSVVDMQHMFSKANSFNQDISSWVVSSATDMGGVFYEAYAFNQDISGWDVSNVTTMSEMFYRALDFNQDISGWNVSNVTYMNEMFYQAYSFDQDLGGWNVANVENMNGMFSGVTLSTENYNALLIGWEALDLYDGVNFHGGNSNYHPGATATARANIISDDSWTITDGGEIPTCPAPTSQTESNILLSSADLEWTSGGATTWDIEYGPNGFIPGSGTMVSALATNSYSLTGLTEQTAYDWYVRDDCGGGDFSLWIGPSTFATNCSGTAITSFPFNEGFNSSSSTQSCWIVLNENGDGYEWDLDYSSNPYEGDEAAILYTDGNNGNNNDYLISPQITLTGNEQLSFFYRVESQWEPNDFELLLSTTGHDPEDFTTTLVANSSFDNTEYAQIVVNLSAYTGNVFIAWHVIQGGLDGWRLYIDDVIVGPADACPQPMLQTALTGPGSANLGWTENGTANTWDIEWGADGFTQGTGTTVTAISSNSYNLTGLSTETNYDWYVRADCGGGSTSNWTGPHSFSTTDGISTNPTPSDGVKSVSLSTSQLDWDDVFGADSYTITIGTTSGGNDIADAIACPGSSYAYSGWTSNTQYYWTVTTIYNGGSTVVGYEWDFTIECDPFSPDYSEDFASYLPGCWSEARGVLSNNTIFTDTSSSNWTDDDFANNAVNGKSAKINIYSTGRDEWIISPTIDLSGGDYMLSFDLALTDYGNTNPPEGPGPDDTFAVVISTDGGLTWSSNNILKVWPGTTNISTTGETVSIDLSDYNSLVRIGFYAASSVSNVDNDLFIDNFEIGEVSVLGIKDNKIKDFSVYPNPTNDILFINAKEEMKSVKIFNLLGQQLVEKSVNSKEAILDVKLLPIGTYYILIYTHNTIKSVQFLIE